MNSWREPYYERHRSGHDENLRSTAFVSGVKDNEGDR